MTNPRKLSAAVIGGGPAGLMAAEVMARGGAKVAVYDAMPSIGRKFLLAGVGGMNLTHSEPLEPFLSRYGAGSGALRPLLENFGPGALRQWALGLGVSTFVGTSGRIFPTGMKAAPLLRAWQRRLRESGVTFHPRHRWRGWSASGRLDFSVPDGVISVETEAVVLALGGGSWPRLGSDGAWMPLLAGRGVEVVPLQPSNCGFDVDWTEHFSLRFAGQPVKPVVASCTDAAGTRWEKQGEFIVTQHGVEGGLIYALSAPLRVAIAKQGPVPLFLDLAPGRELQKMQDTLSRHRGSKSLANHLRARAGIGGVKAGLLREVLPAERFSDPIGLAAAIKALPLRLTAPRPLTEAISSAGGVTFEALDSHLMLRALPGVFCAGEMLDWEAPTGGYLLTACFASGYAAGQGALAWLKNTHAVIASPAASI